MLYALLFSLLFAGNGVSYAQAQTDSLKLVDTTHPESFTEGQPDTVSFTFNKAIDTTAHFPGTGPLGFWRIIPVDSAEIDSFWVSEDLKTVSYQVEHKSRSDYTWLLENARAKDSTYLKQPYHLFYKLRFGNVNRFSVSGIVDVKIMLKRDTYFETENLQDQQYISYHIPALSNKKPTVDNSSTYTLDSVKYAQFFHGNPYKINEVTPGTYWPVLMDRTAYYDGNEDSWVRQTNFITAYDPDNDDRPDSIVVKQNNLGEINFEASIGSTIDDRDERIDGFQLKANYPNPFNPSTEISFSLPRTAEVRLTVLDLMGRKVATLVDEWLPAGNRTVTFDAGNLSSGVYLYRLQADGYTETRKMMLVK